MNAFRYQAIELGGAPVQGVIEAEDRKSALQLLGKRGLFPSHLEMCSATEKAPAVDGEDSIQLPTAQNQPGWSGCQVVLSFPKGQLVNVACRKRMRTVEIQHAPITPGVDIVVKAGVFGLHAHGLVIGVGHRHPEAAREALVELRLQAVVRRAVADVAVLHVRLLPIRGEEWLAGLKATQRAGGVQVENGGLVDAMIAYVSDFPCQIERQHALYREIPGLDIRLAEFGVDEEINLIGIGFVDDPAGGNDRRGERGKTAR